MSGVMPIDVAHLSAFDRFTDIAQVNYQGFGSTANVKLLFFRPAKISISLIPSDIRNKLGFYAEGFARENYAIMGNKKYVGVSFNTDMINIVTVEIHTPRNNISFTTNTQNGFIGIELIGITYVEFYIRANDVVINIYTQTYNMLRRKEII